MRLRAGSFAIALFPLGVLVGAAAFQEGKKPQEKAPMSQEEAMAAMMPQPGPHHAKIREIEGTWDVDVEFTMAPGAPPTKWKGVETNKPVGGFWNAIDFKGEFMGAPFHGHGLGGYDSTKGKHVGVWVDSMGDYIVTSEGTCDGACRVETLAAEMPNPMTGEKVIHKQVHEWKDANTRVFTMSGPGPDGKEQAVMKAVYRRRK